MSDAAFNPRSDSWPEATQRLMGAIFPSAAPLAFLGAVNAPRTIDEQFSGLLATWKESIEKWTTMAQQSAKGQDLNPGALRELFAPERWGSMASGSFDSGLREVLEGPKYATLWSLDREMLQLQQRARERDKHVLAFQAILQKAWNTAFERFSRSVSAREDQTAGTWRGLVDRWVAVVNETLIEVQRSDEFIAAQTRMLRAASEYRLQEQALAESWCAAHHIPTRSEMDEMQRTVTELRRQLRLHRRQLAPQPLDEVVAATRKPRSPAPKTRRTTRA